MADLALAAVVILGAMAVWVVGSSLPNLLEARKLVRQGTLCKGRVAEVQKMKSAVASPQTRVVVALDDAPPVDGEPRQVVDLKRRSILDNSYTEGEVVEVYVLPDKSSFVRQSDAAEMASLGPVVRAAAVCVVLMVVCAVVYFIKR